ncbi:MAG: G5 domain-containing protein [Clostridia bacterium]|nr:G5 domain-containing protein [Clostridia bacterium]
MISKLKKWAGARSSFQKAAAIASVLAVLCTITVFAAENSSYYVELDDGTTKTTIYTSSTTPEEIFEEAGMEVSPLDELDLSAFVPGEDSVIKVEKASLVGVNDDKGTVYFTFDGTVAEAIDIARIEVGENDLINYSVNQQVTDGMIISVAYAFPVAVCYHGEHKNLEMAVGTVADALELAGVTVGENDVVSHDLTEVVSSGMVIFVDEVIYKEKTVTEEIPFEKTTKKNSAYFIGTSKITTKGVNGEKQVTYKQKFVNGVLIDSVVQSETVTKEPVTQVTSVGTKKKTAIKANGQPVSTLGTVELDSNGIPKNYTRTVSGSSTAYYGGGSTASGRPAKIGHVAVDPNVIPYGTRLYIVADGIVYGYAIAADTGGFVNHSTNTVVDVYFDTYDDCVKWGRRDVTIYVLD